MKFVQNHYYLSVTIGRNIDAQPMSDKDWQQFISDVKDIVNNAGDVPHIFFVGTGFGIWAGQAEESFTYAVPIYFNYKDVQGGIDALNAKLAKLANKYQQDAIARVLVPVSDDGNWKETLVYADK